MKRIVLILSLCLLAFSACLSAELLPTPTLSGDLLGTIVAQTITAKPTDTLSAVTSTMVQSTPIPSPVPPTQTPPLAPLVTPTNTPQKLGPANFPAGVDPLTGLQIPNPALLARRPLAIKVSNLPRNNRPQWGLSLADLVFEYYTEEGTTRFIALFYGNDASIVGPIRSARFFDIYVVDAYKAVFAYGYAYVAEQNRLKASDFSNRLVIEAPGTPLYRYNGGDNLVVDTAALSAYITHTGVANGRQDLDGMSFNPALPAGGLPANRIFVHYSSAIYNRWDYDASTSVYLRFADTADDFSGGLNEQYAQSTDRLTKLPLAFDNVVVLYVNHKLYSPGIYDIQLIGQGQAYAFRDGQGYQLKWNRSSSGVVSLAYLDGTPFSFKSGTTWFEVVGLNSTLDVSSQGWRFTHYMP